MTPIRFRLGVHLRISIHLARRGPQDRRLTSLSKAEHVYRPVDTGLNRSHRVVLIVDGRCRAGEVEDLINFNVKRERDVVAYQLEFRLPDKMRDVSSSSRTEIVHAQDLVSFVEEPIARGRAEKACATCYEHPYAIRISHA